MKKCDEPFQALAVGAREAQHVVDVVEPIADLVSRPLRSRQSDLLGVAPFDELLELGAGMGGAQLRGTGHLLRQHRCPPVRETVKYLAGLNRQFLDSGLEVRGLLVDELFKVLECGPEGRFDEHSAGEDQQPGIAAGQPPQCLQSATLEIQGLRNVRPPFAARECFEQSGGFLRSNPLQSDEPKELVERLCVAADGIEDSVCGPEQKDFRALDETCSQCMSFALIAQLVQDSVKVLYEQNQPPTACLAIVHECRKRIGGEAFLVALVSGQRVGSIGPLGIVRGAGQMAQGGEPEIRQIPDFVAFLVEWNRLPDGGKLRSLLDCVQEAQPECGLSHAARADEHHVLTWPARRLFPEEAEHLLESFPARDERRLQLVRGQLGGVVEAPANHGAICLP